MKPQPQPLSQPRHPERRAPLAERLAVTLGEIREDARRAPVQYARDTEVPEGGE